MELLLGLLAVLVILGFLGLLLSFARNGKPAIESPTGYTLRHSMVLRLFSLTVLVGGGMLFALWKFLAPPQEARNLALFFLGLGLLAVLGIALLWEAYRWRLTVTAEGLDCRSPWKRRLYIPWSQVTSMRFSTANGWYVISCESGSFRVPGVVPGHRRLIADYRRHFPDRA